METHLSKLRSLAMKARTHKSTIHSADLNSEDGIYQTYRVIEAYSDSYEQFAELYTKEDAEYFIASNPTEIIKLLDKLDLAVEALNYCSVDDPLAVDPDNKFDACSANEWKKIKARETLAKLREDV